MVIGCARPIAEKANDKPAWAPEVFTAFHSRSFGATAVRAKREARGERPIGRKIGFTNRTIWWSYPALMDGLGLRQACLGHHASFRIRWARDSPGPSGGGTGCRSLR